MKIAVIAQGRELNSPVDPRFGRARFFIVAGGLPELAGFELLDGFGDGSGRAGIDRHAAGPESGERLGPDVACNHGLGAKLDDVSARLNAGALGGFEVLCVVGDREPARVRGPATRRAGNCPERPFVDAGRETGAPSRAADRTG